VSDETLLSSADRKRIAEIVRVEVRLAVKHLFDVLEHNGTVRRGTGYHLVGEPPPHVMSITDNWVYAEPFS